MEFKTTPFKHQLEEFELSRNLENRALFWEMGTGKTKLVLDTAAHLFLEGRIDGLLVVAPNGVHEAWVLDEIPKHLAVPWLALAYRTQGAGTLRQTVRLNHLLDCPRDGLPVLAMSYDAAFGTKHGRSALEAFLARRRCLYVLDESQRIKNSSAKRTRAALATGYKAAYRRILTGTPVVNRPFDVFSQVQFLDHAFWARRGFASFWAFKTYFGILQPQSGFGGRTFHEVVGYRHLDLLGKILGDVSSRVMKDQVLDLPPKLYQKRYFELPPNHRRVYDELAKKYIAELDAGVTLTAELAIVRLLRLQQIACGYAPDDCGEGLHHLSGERLGALEDLLEDLEGQVVIFARFKEDVNQICGLLGDGAVRYDGQVGDDARLEARRRFQAGEVRYFVGNPAAAGLGLNLQAASAVVYYSNSFNLGDRLQSEDRAHRIGQTRAVTYVDVVAQDTVDEKVVEALREKKRIADEVVGGKLRRWLE